MNIGIRKQLMDNWNAKKIRQLGCLSTTFKQPCYDYYS